MTGNTVSKLVVLPVLPFFRFVYSVVLFSGLPAVFPGAVYSASCVVGAASGWPSSAMHLSTSRIRRLTRARAFSRLRPPPASPSVSCMRASSASSSRTRSSSVRFSERSVSRCAVSSAQRSDSLLWSSISCRTRASMFVITLLSAMTFG